MVSKLSMIHIHAREGFLTEDTHRLYRDEVAMVIVDTMILLGSEDTAATLDGWLESV